MTAEAHAHPKSTDSSTTGQPVAPLVHAHVTHLLDAIGDLYFTLDHDWRFTYLNQHALVRAQKPAGELLGRALWEVYPGLLGTPVEAHYRRAMSTGETVHFEIPGLLTGRWFEVYACPSVDGLTVYSRDITERKEAERALHASEELNHRILQSVHAGVITVAPDGRILQANIGAERILGMKWDHLARQFIHEYETDTFYEDGRPCPVEDYPASKCLKTGLAQPPLTIGVRRPDGEISWCVYTTEPLLDPQTGQLSGAVVTFVDITHRKKAEQAQRETEERLRRFFEAAFEGLVIHEGGIIRDANATFAAMFGYEVSETIGRDVVDLAAPAYRERVRAAVRSGCEQPYEGLGLRKDGTTFPVELCGKNLHCDDRTLRVTALRDVTERKRAEAQLRLYAERLEDLSRRLLEVQEAERRHLARELHDEIGQALTALQLGLKASAALPPERRVEGLTRAQKCVAELMGQVRDLSQSLRPTMLDDLGLLPALLWHFRRYTDQTGVRVHFEHNGLGNRFPPAVETAAYRIVQEALTNVARHAGVAEATVTVRHADDRLHIAVADHGLSFDPEAVLATGTGMGLSGMRKRAMLLGGDLLIQSTPGLGTCLTAELPLAYSGDERGETHADIAVSRRS